MHCIGVDVSKQELVTYDGVSERVFANTPGLHAFRRAMGSDLHLTDRILQADLPASTTTHCRRSQTSLNFATQPSARSRSALPSSPRHGK